MSDPVWYRSLYWRIALGFVGLVAALLLLQGFGFLWMTGRMTDFFPSRSPAQFAATVAAEVASVGGDPAVDLEAHVRERFGDAFRAFVVVTADGRTIASERVEPPPMLARAARGRLLAEIVPNTGPGRGERFRGRGGGGRGDGPFGRGRGFPGDPDGRGGFPPAIEFAPAAIGGVPFAVVAVPVEPPPISAALRDLGPILAAVALALLAAGTALAALLIFGPAHRRLRNLQHAARALGGGEAGVRATERGGDEVAQLARTFNEMAARLEDRTRALETADRTRRQLLADVSHELSTPLAAVRGYVETLAMPDLALDPATRDRYLRIVHEETERLEHIIGDLLDLARLEGGGGTFKRESVVLRQLFERVRARHERVLAEKGLALETPDAPDPAVVEGDPNRLEQALQNLVSNAVRHTPSGGRVSIDVASLPDGRVRLVVEDTGPGIPPEHLARVFDRFYKVDVSRTGTATPSGSGLGLSIVQAIVARHGGAVTASNAPAGGARFEVVLPGGDHGPGRPSPSVTEP